jgi:hypothetical protein
MKDNLPIVFTIMNTAERMNVLGQRTYKRKFSGTFVVEPGVWIAFSPMHHSKVSARLVNVKYEICTTYPVCFPAVFFCVFFRSEEYSFLSERFDNTSVFKLV